MFLSFKKFLNLGKSMYKIIFFLSIVFSQFCFAQQYKLDSIICLNLEEDKGPFATFNDEICVLSAIYSIEKDSLLSWKVSPIYEFTDSTNKQAFNLEFNFLEDSSAFAIIALIEMDDKTSTDSLSSNLLNIFEAFKYHPQNFIHDNFRIALGDNDLIGFSRLNYKQFSKLEKKLIFKGMHIFNKYHYELVFSES